jgi:hypothetical protein
MIRKEIKYFNVDLAFNHRNYHLKKYDLHANLLLINYY